IERITIATLFPTAEDKEGFRFSGQLCQEGNRWAGGDARPRRALQKCVELVEFEPRLRLAIRAPADDQDRPPSCCRTPVGSCSTSVIAACWPSRTSEPCACSMHAPVPSCAAQGARTPAKAQWPTGASRLRKPWRRNVA